MTSIHPTWSAAQVLATPHAELVTVAGAHARALHGNAISYSRKVFAPLTQLCRDYCG